METCRRTVAFVALLALVSCEGDVAGPGREFVYPLSVGNRWEYLRTLALFNFRPVSGLGKSPAIADSMFFAGKSEVVRRDSLPGARDLAVIRWSEEPEAAGGEEYHANRQNGLYLYGYRNPGPYPPKAGTTRIRFAGRQFTDPEAVFAFVYPSWPTACDQREPYIENPPVKELAYPLFIGARWVVRAAHNPWRTDKRVLRAETIRVPAGAFRCLRIQWLVDLNDDGTFDSNIEFYDWLASVGVVRRSAVLRDLEWIDQNGRLLGHFDSSEETVLTGYRLVEPVRSRIELSQR